MKKIDVLKWGLQHIAGNYQMGVSVDDLEETGEAFICVTEKHPDMSPAPINDVQMLCQDLGIKRDDVETDSYGVTVYAAWYICGSRSLLEEYQPTGREMWKKFNVKIGEYDYQLSGAL